LAALAVLDLPGALRVAENYGDDEEAIALLDHLRDRRLSVEGEQSAFAMLCDRWDNLYFPQGFTKGGASHWYWDKSATDEGRTHVSVNTYQTYVDIPAALQSYPPIENMLPVGTKPEDRTLAALVERAYFAWKDQIGFELLMHKANTVKCLYGRTAAKVVWDADLKYPVVEVIDQPRNLYLGWKDSQYTSLDWALYSYAITPSTALEDWGLVVECGYDSDGKPYPYVVPPILVSQYQRVAQANQLTADLRVEVNDYWYRKPRENARIEKGKPVKFETWNAIFVGNVMVKNKIHREYDGKLPYVVLFNSYIPGLPTGRSSLHDVEQLIREKDERMSENAQMIHRAVTGQYWQLTGAEAPLGVQAGIKPVPNQVIGTGPGNRIEALQPWMPEFQLEQYLTRVDRELTDISGLNELMRGMAPQQVMNSGRAISALVSNYETRIAMPRQMYYDFRTAIWELASTMWANKDPDLRGIINETTHLQIDSPSLTPRDDAEAAQIAANLKESKLWSSLRAMDRVGVDDPETEIEIIKAEQTDASLNPAQVQVMVSLMLMLQQLQQQQPPALQQAGAEAAQSTEEGLAAMRGLAPGSVAPEGMQGPGEQPVVPPEQMPGNTPEGQSVGAGPVTTEEGAVPAEGLVDEAGNPIPSQALNQFQVANGEVSNRLIGQQQLQKEGE
jgi:hypothetical protein